MARMVDSTNSSIPLDARDGKTINLQVWEPSASLGRAPTAAVQIAHGMGEHIDRYRSLAERLSSQGYWVYGYNHRGHGPDAASNLGAMGIDGWNQTLADMHQVNLKIQQRHPQLPLVLLGHSMGSMLTSQYLYRWGQALDAVVLSGTPGLGHPLQSLMLSAVASFERWRHGQDGTSELLQKLLFADSNTAFDGPSASGYEWLSRDPAQVQRYVDDPLCGFVLSAGSLVDMARGRREAARQSNLRSIPKQLPLYLISGTDDPVHGGQKNLDRMLKAYRGVGVNPEVKLYPQARHELFNETNNDEVIADLLTWLDAQLANR